MHTLAKLFLNLDVHKFKNYVRWTWQWTHVALFWTKNNAKFIFLWIWSSKIFILQNRVGFFGGVPENKHQCLCWVLLTWAEKIGAYFRVKLIFGGCLFSGLYSIFFLVLQTNAKINYTVFWPLEWQVLLQK